jgi:Ca-activated chloride channel family protein
MNANHHQNGEDDGRAARLTAYALGQLDAQEQAAVESEIAASAEGRTMVDAIRTLSLQVREAAGKGRMPERSSRLRDAVEARLRQLEAMEPSKTVKSSKKQSRRTLLAVLLTAASVVALAVPGYLIITGNGERSVEREFARSAEVAASEKPKDAKWEDAKERPDEKRVSRDWIVHGFTRSVPRPSNAAAEPAPSAREIESNPMVFPDAGIASHDRRAADTEFDADDRIQSSGEQQAGSGREPRKRPAVEEQGGQQPASGPRFVPGRRMGLESKLGDTLNLGERPSVGGQSGMPAEQGQVASAGESRDKESLAEEAPREIRDAVELSQKRDVPSDSTRLNLEAPGFHYRAPGTEQYDPIAENLFLAVAKQPLSTFAIDVDTASYANVRRFLNEGRRPPRDAVRIEELINYFPYHYAPPNGETPFAVHLEVAQCPWNGNHRLARVALKGREVQRERRGPSNLVFLLDVSGSMAEPNKLDLVKQAMLLLVEQLGENDRVAIVTYADETGLRLKSTNASRKREIADTIQALSANGSTNGGAGIQLAYQQARENFLKEGNNRVIWATDGDLNVGITSDAELVRLIQQESKSGVFLTVLGVGTGNLKDSKLEKIADRGHGSYHYLDSLREARKVLVEQLSGSTVTIAKDVKIQVEFNPSEVGAYRLIGYENRRMAARDFHNDKKEAGDIGAGHAVTALYELVPRREEQPGETTVLKYQKVPERNLTDAARNGELLTVRLRYKEPQGEHSRLLEFALRDSEKRFGQATADFQFAAAVASFGMLLRGSRNMGNTTFGSVEEIAAATLGDDPNGYRAEFVDLVRKAKQMR